MGWAGREGGEYSTRSSIHLRCHITNTQVPIGGLGAAAAGAAAKAATVCVCSDRTCILMCLYKWTPSRVLIKTTTGSRGVLCVHEYAYTFIHFLSHMPTHSGGTCFWHRHRVAHRQADWHLWVDLACNKYVCASVWTCKCAYASTSASVYG